MELTEQEIVRRGKLDNIKEYCNPYPENFERTHTLKEARLLPDGTSDVRIAGRIVFMRKMGKLSFIRIRDIEADMQLEMKIDVVGEDNYDFFKKQIDTGDFIGAEGEIFTTQTGEKTLRVHNFNFLGKALRPLPEKFHGLTDIEERYRRRYVDLIMNEESKRVAFLRPRIIRCIQNFMDNRGFTEVETPVLTTLLTGASARPFVTHHNAQDLDMYLRIALELHLKRLLVGGMDAVYEIGRLFRNEGMDLTHNPEFTSMEAYLAYSDLDGMMEMTESLLKEIASKVFNKTTFNWRGHEISLEGNFKRITMTEAIKEQTGIDFSKNYTNEEMIKLAEEHDIELEPHEKVFGHIVNKFFEKYVEETLIQPTFLCNHPIEISPLTKKDPKDPRFVQRFELFIGGKEMANAYTELNDPIDQLERFIAQLKEQDLGNEEANDIDMDFVEALEYGIVDKLKEDVRWQYGMPPAGGIGYGIDRLVMFFTENESIRDVILFPLMKPETKEK